MKLLTSIVTLAAAVVQLADAVFLDVGDPKSIADASRVIAYGLQSYYVNNQSTTPPVAVGTWPGPTWYWWKAAAIWGGMVDYWAYTGDTSWISVTQQGILAQIGPDYDFQPPAYYGNLGNDDQAMWAVAALSALEYGFPVPQGQQDSFWLDLATNVFNRQIARWDTASCDGGLRWQVFEANKGYNYKNSISNGGLFQIAARLAHYTGNQTYLEWAGKTWDWMYTVGLIDHNSYAVFDGTDSTVNCSSADHTQWTYNPAMLIYGTAVLANLTDMQTWKDRTDGLLTAIENNFFSAFSNASHIMVETACEPTNNCNDDELVFKAFLSRYLAKSAIVYPDIAANVKQYMAVTAAAAAQACSGNTAGGSACGTKWFVGGFDGRTNYDQQLTALETVQSLLLLDGSAMKSIPDTSDTVQIQVVPVTNAPSRRSARGRVDAV